MRNRRPYFRPRRGPYDPATCVTAGQLRSAGFYVAENVDDAAFVRRAAVGLDNGERLDDGSATVGLVVLEPFVAAPIEELLCLVG